MDALNIQVAGKFQFKDFWDAIFWHKPIKKIVLLASLGLILSTGLISMIINRQFTNWFGLLIPLGIFILLPYQSYSAAKRSYGATKDRVVEFVFTPMGYEITTDTTSVYSEWSNLHKITETKNNFLLFSQPNMMYPIPKRFFANEHKIADFRELLSVSLNKKAQLKK